ncbi:MULTISPECIES: M3 family metallopeptidase [Henriciella]|uniref:Dipeptidyl carboxypeptidase II n=1 Tax=Henriciella pelagia TaxID=1977912 RepID=A0ABQ1JLZ6_9PROT|nr:M3 family metallopeptidase [Henriciella pelagia]GGB70386.1 dipeptidyl carboxypeptidase II [Henriciella pelagia]
MTLKSILMGGAAALALVVSACSPPDGEAGSATTEATLEADTPAAAGAEAATAEPGALQEISVSDAELEGNPFLEEWETPYGVPPFAEIEDEHYLPAVKKGILEARAGIEAITSNADAPTFENTIVALDQNAELATKVLLVFGNITGTDTNDRLRELEGIIYPMVTREQDAIVFNNDLWQRVKTVYEARDTLGLDEQDARLLELTHRQFTRAGADLPQDVKDQIADINSQISSLTTKFGQNLLRSTKAFRIEVTDEADLAGLSQDFKDAIRMDGDEDKWLLTVDRSVYETFMTQSENRDLRKKMFDGYRLRASEGEFDNGPIAIEIAQLRAKRAELMGYPNHAAYVLETNMAKTPEGAEEFLLRVWRPGLAQAKAERAEMQALIGDEFTFAGHDWWHYSEKVRQNKYAFDDNALKPYFELGAVQKGAFDVSSKLFNIEITPVDVEGWNEVVNAFEVTDAETGDFLGLFMSDMYARDSKRGGAWMSSFRTASNVNGQDIRPIVANNMNLIQPPEGQPTLMRFDEVTTLFHEFGHGLHGLLTQIRYQNFSGVDGPRDYTEFPAQILEHWASAPEVLEDYAKHYQTGETIPLELIERMNEAANHNQGFATTEYIAASLLDLNWHMLSYDEAMAIEDARAFEKSVLDKYGLIEEIEPRYRSNYFSHIFAGGYSAGYYAYLWSEILDADGFEAFREAGDIFDPELAAKLKRWVYESGGLREADELYRNFRGSDPTIEPLLRNRGFDVTEQGDG